MKRACVIVVSVIAVFPLLWCGCASHAEQPQSQPLTQPVRGLDALRFYARCDVLLRRSDLNRHMVLVHSVDESLANYFGSLNYDKEVDSRDIEVLPVKTETGGTVELRAVADVRMFLKLRPPGGN